jgi:hypothetical protein
MAITQRLGFSMIPLACELYPQYHIYIHNSIMGMYRMQIFKARMELLLSNLFPLCLIKNKCMQGFIGSWSNTIPLGLIEKWMKSLYITMCLLYFAHGLLGFIV